MKLWIMSDLHQEFDELTWRPSQAPDHDVLILAGDIHVGARQSVDYAASLSDKPVILVAGNHESYGHEITQNLANMRIASAQYPHLHFLENDAVNIDGVRFIGATLWTDLRQHPLTPIGEVARTLRRGMNDYRRIKILRSDGVGLKRLDPRHALGMHRASQNFLLGELQARRPGTKMVVVTHHSPSILGCSPAQRNEPLASAYASNLDTMIYEHRPTLWVHGHTHHGHQTTIGETRLVSNARGYVADGTGAPFNPEFVLEV